MTLPMDTAIPVPVHFDGHNINIISDTLPSAAPQPKAPQTSPSNNNNNNSSNNSNNNKDRQSLYKTELCREWSTSGWCYYGKRCSFAHGLNELRPVFRSKKWRTKRCRNWQSTGYCPYEHRCQFLHDQTPPRQLYEDDEATSPGGTKSGEVAEAGAPTTSKASKSGSTKGNATKSLDGPTMGDGGRQLYFHFEVRAGDAEEESEESDGSENVIGGARKTSSTRRSGNVHKGKTRVTVSKDGKEVLNDIGNNLMGEGSASKTSPMNLSSLIAGAPGTAKSMGKRRRRKPRTDPVVTPIARGQLSLVSGATAAAAANATTGANLMGPRTNLKGSASGSESPPPPTHPMSTNFVYPGQLTQLEMMQAQQIMANQATAKELASHLASVQLAGGTTGTGMPSIGTGQPFFGGDGGAASATTAAAAANLAAIQNQHQLMAALQRMSSNGGASAEAGATSAMTLEAMMGGGGGGAGAVSSPPPPSVPMDWAGLAGGLPSIPMSQGEANAALVNAMYSMGPSLTELYYTARLNQMPTTDLEQLCMGLYPPTAPVPFASTPMTPGGGLSGMTGMADGVSKNAPTGTTANRHGESGGVYDRTGLNTPSGSVEPPGYDSAFYPTPSPPPSSFGGLDSVSNMHGVRFVPNDPSAVAGAQHSAFNLAYAAATQQQTGPMPGGPFYFPSCSTPVPLNSPPPMRPITPITPTGMYGGFPSFFGGPPVAQAVPTTSTEMAGAPVIARPVTGLAGAATTNLSGGSTS